MRGEEGAVIQVEGVSASDYLAGYRDADRFLAYCLECPEYGKGWMCPPFSPSQRQGLEGYEWVLLIGARLAAFSPLQRDTAGRYPFVDRVRALLDPQLLASERAYAGSLLFYPGRCRACNAPLCARAEGLPCRAPALARPSLESYGFDVARSAGDILGFSLCWSDAGELPPYISFISALWSPAPFTSSQKEGIHDALQHALAGMR